MHYYIDGYNIIFRVLHAKETLQLQREALIYDLSYKATLFNLDLTLVFDSHYQEGESTKSHLDRLEIVYTAKGESADDYIIKAIKHGPNPKQEMVVTSDNHLAWKVRSFSGKAEPVEEFMDRLQKRFRNHLQTPDSDVEPPVEPEQIIPIVAVSKEMPTLIRPLQKIIEKLDPESQIPTKVSLPEDCFDYYQKVFEQEYETLESSFPTLIKASSSDLKVDLEDLPHETPKPRKKKADKTGQIEEKLSDSERWLKAFEEKNKSRSDEEIDFL